MANFKCLVPPERSGYAATPDSKALGVVNSQLEGGLGRYRADQLGSTALVTVQWSVGKRDYDYLQAMNRQYPMKGLPIDIDLILDHSTPDTYTAYVVPGTWNLNSQIGETYIIQASLEVLPLPDDPIGDAELLARN
jgi:hypothetical protein